MPKYLTKKAGDISTLNSNQSRVLRLNSATCAIFKLFCKNFNKKVV